MDRLMALGVKSLFLTLVYAVIKSKFDPKVHTKLKKLENIFDTTTNTTEKIKTSLKGTIR